MTHIPCTLSSYGAQVCIHFLDQRGQVFEVMLGEHKATMFGRHQKVGVGGVRRDDQSTESMMPCLVIAHQVDGIWP